MVIQSWRGYDAPVSFFFFFASFFSAGQLQMRTGYLGVCTYRCRASYEYYRYI